MQIIPRDADGSVGQAVAVTVYASILNFTSPKLESRPRLSPASLLAALCIHRENPLFDQFYAEVVGYTARQLGHPNLWIG